MLFWIVAGTLAALVAALLARPLLRSAPAGPEASPDQAIYRDQLLEVERDLARGLLAPAEAERARTEIARRLLAADRAQPAVMQEAPGNRNHLAVVAVVATIFVTLVLYYGSANFLRSAGVSEGRIEALKDDLSLDVIIFRVPVRVGLVFEGIGAPGRVDEPRAERLAEAEALRDARPSQAEAEAQAARMFPAEEPEAPADYLAMIEELRRVVPTRPDDLQGWELLALHEARLGRYADAARAQERVLAIKGGEATAQDWLDLADRMVAAAGGIVTPEAEAVLAEIDARDPENLGLLYYRGLLEAQTGRPDRAFPLWRRVVERADPESLHYRLAAGQIEEVAWLAGVDYTVPAPSGPRQGQAAEGMDPGAQAEMIQGMVDGLRERLASEGGPPEDWARLVTSLAVLGDGAGAREALAQAKAAHEGDAEATALLDRTAQEAGLR